VSTIDSIDGLREAFANHPLLEYSHNHIAHHVQRGLIEQPALLLILSGFVRGCRSFPYYAPPSPGVSTSPRELYVVYNLPPLHVACTFNIPSIVMELAKERGMDVNAQCDRATGGTG